MFDKSSTQKGGRKYVAIKININTLSEDWLKGRRKIAERLAKGDPHHPGYHHIRFMIDAFKIKGPQGQHFCVVYDVLREPIGVCMDKFRGHLFNSSKLRKLIPPLLQGLDYMHSVCHIVHTDLKPDNVMLGLGDPAVLDHFVEKERANPTPRKKPDSHGRIIYKSRNDFGDAPTDQVIETVKIIDIGLAEFGDVPHNTAIQSNAFTAPEVILAAGWSYPADIWNLGVMLWDLFENFGLFDAIDTRPSHYHSDQHLGLMIALMGPPPKELLARGSTTATYFDDDGNFRQPKLIPTNFTFETAITKIRGKEKELFIDFVKKMICWLPEERWTAKQLLDHPWLKCETSETKAETKEEISTSTGPAETKQDTQQDSKQDTKQDAEKSHERDAKRDTEQDTQQDSEQDSKQENPEPEHQTDSNNEGANLEKTSSAPAMSCRPTDNSRPKVTKQISNASTQELINSILKRK